MNEKLIKQLQNVTNVANYSKKVRLLNNPFKYISAIFYREFIYPKTKQEKIVNTKLFYGKRMIIALPASTDIYLTGGKSHSSEIRLALYMLKNLAENDGFLDIGAHFGYFTLLASEVVGIHGKVLSFEPSTKSFNLLKQNTASLLNVKCFQKAISNAEENITFYEFPNLHSEYNATNVSQFENENWFTNSIPTRVEVNATTIDKITDSENFNPKLIKIDVEGAEYDVIKGGINHFKNYAPIIVMEYLEPKRKNEAHVNALLLLNKNGYNAFIIKNDGNLESITDVDIYLINNKLESDNIVFIKQNF